MILKGSQRGGGQDLAVHLMRTDENEHVRLHELREFASDDLKGAFKEAEAVSFGTNCRQYLFSLSLSPPEDARVSVAEFEEAIDRIEGRLGLDGQPRAIVFHEKEGRRHAHCVWSRIDAATMTARPLPFFKNRLMEVSRSLYLDHGWKMPRGMMDSGSRDPTNFTLAEWQQAKRQGVDPRWIKTALQECWRSSDNAAAFGRALQERGFSLARGDKRGFVVLAHDGEVQSLPRALGLKTKDVRDRLGSGDDLPSVETTRKDIAARMSPAIRRHVEESRTRFQKRSAMLGHAKMEMTHLHRAARERQSERFDAEWLAETKDRAARLPKGLSGLWHRLTGRYQEVRAQNEAEAIRARASISTPSSSRSRRGPNCPASSGTRPMTPQAIWCRSIRTPRIAGSVRACGRPSRPTTAAPRSIRPRDSLARRAGCGTSSGGAEPKLRTTFWSGRAIPGWRTSPACAEPSPP